MSIDIAFCRNTAPATSIGTDVPLMLMEALDQIVQLDVRWLPS